MTIYNILTFIQFKTALHYKIFSIKFSELYSFLNILIQYIHLENTKKHRCYKFKCNLSIKMKS